MVSVSLHISNLPTAASANRKALPFAPVEGTTIIVKSQLASDLPLNDHLVWLWGMLKYERRYIKGLQSEGANIVVHAKGFRGQVEVRANGAEMLHLLGANLVLDCK